MYRKLELMGGSICGLRRQFSAFSFPLLAIISFLLVTTEAQSTASTVGVTVPDQTALTTIMDTINSLAPTRGPTTEFQLFTTTQTVLPSTLSSTTPTMSPSISTSLPSSSPLGGTATGQTVTTSQLTVTTAATTKSLSTASATSTPLETIGSTTSRGTTLSGTSTQSQSETVSTSLATEIKDNSTEETIATSSTSAVTMATTGIPGPSDALSIIEWFLVAVAVAALIFFLYILYHFCQVKRKRKASAFSEQNKNIIEYATPQSPKEKWRNSWALEAMVYHIELPQETTAEMEARDNVVFEDETDTGGASNHVKPHLTKL